MCAVSRATVRAGHHAVNLKFGIILQDLRGGGAMDQMFMLHAHFSTLRAAISLFYLRGIMALPRAGVAIARARLM